MIFAACFMREVVTHIMINFVAVIVSCQQKLPSDARAFSLSSFEM